MVESIPSRLSRIVTLWSLVRLAHHEPTETAARQQLLARYGRAIHRYLLGALREPDAADDLMQEFAVRFLEGGFHGADPHRGRFRDYVRTALIRLVSRFRQRQRRQPGSLPDAALLPASPAADLDAGFLRVWREELLGRTWAALARFQRETGRPFHAILRCRVEHPQMRSPELAEELTRRLGKRVTALGVCLNILAPRQGIDHLLSYEWSIRR